ncbi:glycosyltransferase family 4 protein [Planococcus sp. YIM B11945]|uniref:glycosyltransferase family 4 protein n=1 Tax=Planococcus sp. YIM B11945 TaxID=3435410 RepID=UPI003D7F0ABA
MRVLFVTHYSNLYGANLSLLYLVEELRDFYNVNPLIVLPSKGPLQQELVNKKIDYEIFPFKSWVSTKPHHLKGIVKFEINKYYGREISKIIKEKKFDIVHTNSSVTPVGALAAKYSGVKHIWHIREFLTEDYGLYFERIGFSTNFINNYSDKVIFISKALLHKYKDKIDKEKQDMIYNGIKPLKLQGIKETVNDSVIKLLIVGTLIKQKGQREAIEAVKHLVETKKQSYILNIVGDGPDRVELERLVQLYKLENHVVFHGYQKDTSMFYINNDITLMCSDKEAFGRTTIESMLAGTPVIGSDSGATSEIIRNKETGLLFNPKDPKDLASKILSLSEKKIIGKMGEKAKREVEAHYLSNINTEKVFNLYMKIMKEN